MEVEFDLTKNKDTTEHINYNYYSTTFYKNQYEKTVENGGYIKLPYPSHSNKPNLVSSVFPDHYITTHLYILKKSHAIRGVDYDGELVIEHISTTNNNKRLYAYLPLKTSPASSFPATKIDDILIANRDSVNIELNDFFMMEQIKEAILYDTQETKTLLFTQPILVKSSFDSISTIDLSPSYSSYYSVLSVKPLLGINNISEGFKEGIDKDVVAAAYCQPIDETDPNIGENADVIIPLNSKLSVNDATNTSLKTVMNFFAFFVLILAAVTVVPIVYNMFIVELVLDNRELKLPQEKLNRLCSIDIYVSVILFGFAFSFINYGIANNVPVFTSIGFYVLIFYISAFLYFQYNRTMNPDYITKFLNKFWVPSNKPEPSFDEVKNDISGLIVDNLKIIFMNYKTITEQSVKDDGTIEKRVKPDLGPNGEPIKEFSFTNVFALGMIYWLLHYIVSYIGLNKNVGSSFLLSLPFYLFLFALYIYIFVKYRGYKLLFEEYKG